MQDSETSVQIAKLVQKRDLFVKNAKLVQERQDFLFIFRNECKNVIYLCKLQEINAKT